MSDADMNVAVRQLMLRPWLGHVDKRLCRSYGSKPIVDANGRGVFVEIAVVEKLRESGWEAVWVDSYRRKYWAGMPFSVEPYKLPDKQQKLLDKIRKCNGRYGGCWDVFAWKGARCAFLECKWKGRDSIRESQVDWYKAAVAAGVDGGSFSVIEWCFEE